MPKQPKARKAGRPPLPKGEAKVGTLRIRVTPEELQAIESKAKVEKQSVSEWIRSTLNAALSRKQIQNRPLPDMSSKESGPGF